MFRNYWDHWHDWDRAKREACPTTVVTSILNFDMNFVLYFLNFLPCFLVEASSVRSSASETPSVRRRWKESTVMQVSRSRVVVLFASVQKCFLGPRSFQSVPAASENLAGMLVARGNSDCFLWKKAKKDFLVSSLYHRG